MLLKKAIKNFIKYMESIDRSKETINGYEKEMKYFSDYLSEKHNSLVYIEDIKLKDLEEYLHYLKVKGNMSASRSRVVYILRSFYNYCERNDLSNKNLAKLIEPVKVKQKEREYLTEDEFSELIDVMGHDIIRTLVETIFYTGLRISEVTSLKLKDIDMKKKIVKVIGGKGNRDRIVPICQKLHDILKNYKEKIRPKVVSSDKFFCTKKTGEVSPQYVNRELKKATEELGWEKVVTAHIIRHSFASCLIAKDASLVSVQKLLGHQDLRVTSRYLHLDLGQLEDAVDLL